MPRPQPDALDQAVITWACSTLSLAAALRRLMPDDQPPGRLAPLEDLSLRRARRSLRAAGADSA